MIDREIAGFSDERSAGRTDADAPGMQRDLVAAYDSTPEEAVDWAMRELAHGSEAAAPMFAKPLEELRSEAKARGWTTGSVCWVLGYPVLIPDQPGSAWNVWLLTPDGGEHVLVGSMNPELRPERP